MPKTLPSHSIDLICLQHARSEWQQAFFKSLKEHRLSMAVLALVAYLALAYATHVGVNLGILPSMEAWMHLALAAFALVAGGLIPIPLALTQLPPYPTLAHVQKTRELKTVYEAWQRQQRSDEPSDKA